MRSEEEIRNKLLAFKTRPPFGGFPFTGLIKSDIIKQIEARLDGYTQALSWILEEEL
jgi:hypothetical protein